MGKSNKVLVVGAGVTGAALSHLLQDAKQTLKHVPEVVVWEKHNVAGGRMMARCEAFLVKLFPFHRLRSSSASTDALCITISNQILSEEPRCACGYGCAVLDEIHSCE